MPRDEIADVVVGWATRLAEAGEAAEKRAAPEPDAEAVEDAEELARLLVRRGHARFEEAGLTAHWDGAPGTRIEISPMEWRRRLPQ
ncbi:DUF6891 domain-containing protein [Nocardiopsis suaedae]|uniref:DUF6891 domain-containing protein n=1 Tax=Nocardiopsis suaedae TaxID=3018444 RepID=A0ABT4TE09_9ACTN|nr:hypothetical protein [Nocardiopsis suaedae]MDA2802945.1 hypothetical protein [Nocardiopsis suaedae]